MDTPTLTADTATDLAARADEQVAPYVAALEAHLAERTAEPEAVAELRRAAMAHLVERGFPRPKDEDWRFTDLKPLLRTSFRLTPTGRPQPDADLINASRLPDAVELVFVDGRLNDEHSRLADLPDGLRVDGLARVLADAPSRVLGKLGHHASVDHPFAALNTALFEDGALVTAEARALIERPVHLLFVSTGRAGRANGTEPTASFPRVLIEADESSQLTVVETYVGPRENTYYTSPTTEVLVGRNAHVDHYKVQRESRSAFHTSMLHVRQQRDSGFRSHFLSTGGGLVRNDVRALLAEPGVTCTLNGLYVANGRQHVDNYMRVEHAAPRCDSRELYKGILDDEAHAVFTGRIYVHQDAQQTDGVQSNRNLLLSDRAVANSNPQLEIFADDVKCTHGSTVGQLDPEAVFYLRSRGIDAEAARSILTYAFASDVVTGVRVDAVRQALEDFLFRRLARGEIVRQAV